MNRRLRALSITLWSLSRCHTCPTFYGIRNVSNIMPTFWPHIHGHCGGGSEQVLVLLFSFFIHICDRRSKAPWQDGAVAQTISLFFGSVLSHSRQAIFMYFEILKTLWVITILFLRIMKRKNDSYYHLLTLFIIQEPTDTHMHTRNICTNLHTHTHARTYTHSSIYSTIFEQLKYAKGNILYTHINLMFIILQCYLYLLKLKIEIGN